MEKLLGLIEIVRFFRNTYPQKTDIEVLQTAIEFIESRKTEILDEDIVSTHFKNLLLNVRGALAKTNASLIENSTDENLKTDQLFLQFMEDALLVRENLR